MSVSGREPGPQRTGARARSGSAPPAAEPPLTGSSPARTPSALAPAAMVSRARAGVVAGAGTGNSCRWGRWNTFSSPNDADPARLRGRLGVEAQTEPVERAQPGVPT